MNPYRIQRFETVTSTNELVKHALEMGYDEGLVCRAAEQVGGYGRQGRIWSSPRGGLYQSVLLRPDVPTEQLSTLSLVVALCVRRAIISAGALLEDDVKVKWPNDVVCADGKLAGISMEAHAGGVCVGIGVNVWHPTVEQQVGGKNTPAFLVDIARNELGGERPARAGQPAQAARAAQAGQSVQSVQAAQSDQSVQAAIDFVGDEVMDELWYCYEQWQREGFVAFLDEFNACNALAGNHVNISDRNGRIVKSGLVTGVDVHGSLLIGDAPISSGEAHIV